MALFKVTTKRLLVVGGKRIEPGLTAEVSYNASVLSLTNPTVKAEILRQFRVKYNIDFPVGYMNGTALNIERL